MAGKWPCPWGCEFRSNFFLLFFLPPSFFLFSKHLSQPFLPFLKEPRSRLPRESVFLDCALGQHLVCISPLPPPPPRLPLPGPFSPPTIPHAYFSRTLSPLLTPASPSLPPTTLAPGLEFGVQGRGGRRGVQIPNAFPGLAAGESNKICPAPSLSQLPPPPSPQKLSSLSSGHSWTKRGWVGLVNHPHYFFGDFQGRERGLSPTPFCRHTHTHTHTHTRTHSPTHTNTQNAEDRAPPRVGTLRPFSWIE